MITINRNILFSIIALLTILVGVSILFNENYILLSLLAFLYLVTIPGALILYVIKIQNTDVWKFILLSVGLSIFFLMIPGLIFNWVWPMLYHSPPLQKELLSIYFGILIYLLINIAYIRNKNLTYKLQLKPFNILKYSYFLIPPFLTILSILGAILLNNSDNNILAIATLTGISASLLITIFLNKKINQHFFPWSIYFYSLALLLSLSLRSWYVSGFDIQSEFLVFQNTLKMGIWEPVVINGAYNACLSITLLPTINAKLTSFPDDYIYKFFYQVIFAFTPVIVFFTFKRFTSSIIAFIAAIYIIAQPLFIQPMTALMRQEIAFIFFALMMYVLFDKKLSTITRNILFLIFGSSMVVSHYSTTYVTLLILLSLYAIIGIIRISERIKFIKQFYMKIKILDPKIKYSYTLKPAPLLFLFAFTIFWYGLVNNQLGQVQRIAIDGVSKMNELFKSEIESSESKKAITFLQNDETSKQDIQAFVQKKLPKNDLDKNRLYSPDKYGNSDVEPVSPMSVRPVISTFFNNIILILLEILKQIFKICVIVGPLFIYIKYFKNEHFPREYIVLCVVSVLIISLVTFHPDLGLNYNLSRLYLQLLFYISLPAILLFFFILSPVKSRSVRVTGALVVFIFIYLTGLSSHLIGGEARVNQNNFGNDYDNFYVHKEELNSAVWLKDNIGSTVLLNSDQFAYLRIYRIFSRGFEPYVLPALIYKDSYVYGSFSNFVMNRSSLFYQGSNLSFSYPNEFLKQNKNTIYNNGGSVIYR